MKIPKTCSILVLDDVESIRIELIEHLKQLGLEGPFHQAEDVRSAMETLIRIAGKKDDVHLILSDWNLPDSSGFELLKQVRGQKHYDKIPFILVTTHDEVEHMIDAINAGCNNYIVKPWTVDILKEKIADAWNLVWDNDVDFDPFG